MRSALALAGAIAAALLAGCPPAGHVAPAAETLPSTAWLHAADGGADFSPADRWRGQVLVLDFWASWCKACTESVPRVRRLAQAFAADGLVVVGVNVGDRPEKARAAATELAIDYPIALDPGITFADLLGASQLPMVLVVDRAGAIVHRARQVDADTLAVIRRLLGAPSSTAR